MDLWQKISQDLQKEFRAGIAFIKGSTEALKKQAKKLSQEEKRHFDIIELKKKIHEQMAGLGGKVYELSSKKKNPLTDKSVTAYLGRIKKLEARINKLEKPPKKKAAKKTTKRPQKKHPKKGT